MEGQDVLTSDDHKLGTVVGERDGFVIVESGHMFKSRHAVPAEFLHEHEGVVRATVGKDVVADSPKVDGDDFDADAVRVHYGLVDVTVIDPDPFGHDADTNAERRSDAHLDRPAFDRTTNSADPAWTTAGTSSYDPQRDDAIERDDHLGDPPHRGETR